MLNNNLDTLGVFTALLNLSEVTVTESRHSDNNRTVNLVVKSTCENLLCRICGQPTKGYVLGRMLHLRHLSILGKETYIEITPRRGRCYNCDDKPTTTERLEWYELNS